MMILRVIGIVMMGSSALLALYFCLFYSLAPQRFRKLFWYELMVAKDKWGRLMQWIAWKLPARVAMWATYRVIAHTSQTGPYKELHPDAIPWQTAINQWVADHKL